MLVLNDIDSWRFEKIVDSNVLIAMFTLKSPMIIVGQTVGIIFKKN